MTYRLYRLAQPTDDPTDGVLLGAFEEFDAALAARDEDTVALFSATGPGELLHAHHQILGPGSRGPVTAHPVSTQIARTVTPNRTEVIDTRDWLEAIHRPS